MKEELIRVAHYYYVLKLNQQEIAEKMAMSRQRVGRLLKRAEEEGVVEIRIRGYSDSCARIEDSLREKLGIEAARIVNSEEDSTISEAALDYIENHIGPGCSVGVAFGRTMAQLCKVQRKNTPGGIKVVQLLGGLNAFQNADYKPDEVASRFAEILGGIPYSLFIPALLNSVELKRLIYAEEQFQPMLKMIEDVDVAVITAGSLRNRGDNILIRDGYLKQDELERLKDMGAVGDVCLHFIDIEGRIVDEAFDQRVVGITAAGLKKIPVRILVSYGPHKVRPIIAAARGRFMNTLITNRSTAEAILSSGLV